MKKHRPIFLRTACSLSALALTAASTLSIADAPEQTLSAVTVKEGRSAAEKKQLPQTTESITAATLAETVNVVDTEDAVKYFPSIFVRKRNNGDTQSIMATRSWGINSSARSLIYADGVLLTALIANDNSRGGPRWGMVAPEEIERIDVMYGPFSAAYPGNSMGAVMEIVTRMPNAFEATASQTEAWQSFSLFGTNDTYRTDQTAVDIGNRSGALAWRLSLNHQDSHSQPLSFITNATQPATSSGGFAATNKTGGAANIYGAGGLLHTRMDNFKFKAALDLTPQWQAIYNLGLWRNDAHSSVQSYLTSTATGAPTFSTTAGVKTGFAGAFYDLLQEHSMHSLTLKSDTKGAWDWEAVVTRFNYDADTQRNPDGTVNGTATFNTTGRIAEMRGTGWETQDLKGIWRPNGAHTASFGYHHDSARLRNATWNTGNWASGNAYTALYTQGNGRSETSALWAQDAWRFADNLKSTLGARWERWRAYEGYNYNSTTVPVTQVAQPAVAASRLSPKASLSWDTPAAWIVTGSLGRAYRFPTVFELYQISTSGVTGNIPNPNLSPEKATTGELAFEHALGAGKLRVSVFHETVTDALISQSTLVGATLFSYVMNVDKVRNRGVEVAAQAGDVGIRGLDLSGSVTYVDSKILADSGWRTATGTTAVDKRSPYVPDWRATLVATYRPSDRLSTTLAARYGSKPYSTMDNTDVNFNTYMGFTGYFVVDAKLRYQVDKNWAATVGIDNLNNQKYFMFHPFPQRTLVANLKYTY